MLAWVAHSLAGINVILGKMIGGILAPVVFIAILLVILEGSLIRSLTGRPYLKANLLLIVVGGLAAGTEVVGTVTSGSPRTPFEWGQIASSAGLVLTLALMLRSTVLALRLSNSAV